MLSIRREYIVSFYELLCKLVRQCLAFLGLTSHESNREDTIHHRVREFRTRRPGGLTYEENFHSPIFQTAFQSCTKARAHQKNRNFWCGEVQDGDLAAEIKRNGYGDLLTSTLYELVDLKKSHERHQQMGSPLSSDQLLTIMFYTQYGGLCRIFRKDEILFSMQDVTIDSDYTPKQNWPIFGRLLNSAICCLNKYDRANRPKTVYHGLNGTKIDPEAFKNSGYETVRTQMNPFFKYGTFISTTTDLNVALCFASPTPGSVLIIDTTPDEHGNEIIIADVSWISWFNEESEYLIARLGQFGVNDLQFNHLDNIYMAKVSVEFFSHRGQKCYNPKHDGNDCGCDIPKIPRPDWMPPPEHGKL